MSAATPHFIEKPLRLAGVDLASRSQSTRMQSRIQSALETALTGSAHDMKQLYQMLNDVPARTVFADEKGLQYTMMLTPAGPIMVPWNTGQALTPETYSNDGGFLSTGLLSQLQSDPDGSTFHQDLQQAALDDLAANNKSKGINPLDLAKSLGQSLLQNLAGQGLQELFKGSQLGDLLTQATSTSFSDLAKSLATGIGSQLASMGIDMAFNALWSVNDESGVAEYLGHTLAGQGLQTVIGSVISAQLTEGASSLGNIKGILDKYLPTEPQPKLAALRVGDVDVAGNKILEPCSANVFIEGYAAARVADPVENSGKRLYLGSANVSINEQIATRIVDTVSNAAPFLQGARRTFIGGKTAGEPPPAALPPVSQGGSKGNQKTQKTSEKNEVKNEEVLNNTHSSEKDDADAKISDEVATDSDTQNTSNGDETNGDFSTPDKRRQLLRDLVLSNKAKGMDDLAAQAEAIRTAFANGAQLDRADLYAVFTGINGEGATLTGDNSPQGPYYVKLGDKGMDPSIQDLSDNQTYHIWVYIQVSSEQSSFLNWWTHAANIGHEIDELSKGVFPTGTDMNPGRSGASWQDFVAGLRAASIGADLASGKLPIKDLPNRLYQELGIQPPRPPMREIHVPHKPSLPGEFTIDPITGRHTYY